jgi:hypothetical protein
VASIRFGSKADIRSVSRECQLSAKWRRKVNYTNGKTTSRRSLRTPIMCSYHADALEIDIFYDEDRVAATWAIGGLAFLKA